MELTTVYRQKDSHMFPNLQNCTPSLHSDPCGCAAFYYSYRLTSGYLLCSNMTTLCRRASMLYYTILGLVCHYMLMNRWMTLEADRQC